MIHLVLLIVCVCVCVCVLRLSGGLSVCVHCGCLLVVVCVDGRIGAAAAGGWLVGDGDGAAATTADGWI